MKGVTVIFLLCCAITAITCNKTSSRQEKRSGSGAYVSERDPNMPEGLWAQQLIREGRFDEAKELLSEPGFEPDMAMYAGFQRGRLQGEAIRPMIQFLKQRGYPMYFAQMQSGVIGYVVKESAETVRVFLEEGASADVLVGGLGSEKPIVLAMQHERAYEEQLDSPLVLAEHTDPNAPATPMGAPPINAAAFYGRTEVMEILHKRGARLDLTNNKGDTALHAAAMFNGANNATAIRLLLKWGADPNVRNQAGETPLDMAKRKKFDKIVAALGG